MEKENIFVKIDTVFIYKVTPEKLYLIEDEYFIFKELKDKQTEVFKIIFEGETELDKMDYFILNDNFKRLILNNKINNIYIIDFAMYINSIENEETIKKLELYENIEKLYKDFIIYLNNFRKEQIIKYTFNIKQRRMSRKKIYEIKEEMKKYVKVNIKYSDVF